MLQKLQEKLFTTLWNSNRGVEKWVFIIHPSKFSFGRRLCRFDNENNNFYIKR